MKVETRYYGAAFGRFITRDSVLSQKPYAYCDGDPINFSDPSGKSKLSEWWKKFTDWLTNGGSGYNWNLSREQRFDLGKDWETTGNTELMLAGIGTAANGKMNPNWKSGSSVFGARFKGPGQVMFVIGAGGLITKGLGMGMQEFNKP